MSPDSLATTDSVKGVNKKLAAAAVGDYLWIRNPRYNWSSPMAVMALIHDPRDGPERTRLYLEAVTGHRAYIDLCSGERPHLEAAKTDHGPVLAVAFADSRGDHPRPDSIATVVRDLRWLADCDPDSAAGTWTLNDAMQVAMAAGATEGEALRARRQYLSTVNELVRDLLGLRHQEGPMRATHLRELRAALEAHLGTFADPPPPEPEPEPDPEPPAEIETEPVAGSWDDVPVEGEGD